MFYGRDVERAHARFSSFEVSSLDFGRANRANENSASKLQNPQEVLLSADLESSEQYIICHVMCDDIGKLSITQEASEWKCNGSDPR